MVIEPPDPGDADLERRETQRAERHGEILGERALDLADEAQGQMKLFVILPAQGR